MGKQPYHSLIVWKEAYHFSLEVYRLSTNFPSHERYGITSQLRRAAVSVVANIVEGHAKHSTLDCLRFLDIAHGSLRECAVMLEFGRDLGYLTISDFDHLDTCLNKTGYLLARFKEGTRSRLPALSAI